MAIKLTPFTARTVEINFNDEKRDLEINFAVIQSMSHNIGNLMEYCQHLYMCVGGATPDPVRLSEFYAELCRQARFTYEGRVIQTELIYNHIMETPDDLKVLFESCLNAALIISPLPDKTESKKPAPKRKAKSVK